MILRPATSADFAFIRGLAGHPDYAPFITDEDEAGLEYYLNNTAHRLLIWQDAQGRVELRRLALARPSQGEGPMFLQALIDYAFIDLQAQRLWLDASAENIRAQKAYLKAGFVFEGRQRAHWFRPALGHPVDLMLYGILRQEWLLAKAPLQP